MVTAAHVASALRSRLRSLYPESAFTVRTRSYDELVVVWFDGPGEDAVRGVAAPLCVSEGVAPVLSLPGVFGEVTGRSPVVRVSLRRGVAG